MSLKAAALTAAVGLVPTAAFVNQVSMEHGIPARAVVAYVEAEKAEGCAWQDIAAVGWREAGHGTYDGRHLDEVTGVLTPALDKWDGWAMGGGPMGFLRPTWEGGGYAAQFPGDGDGGYQDMDAAARATCQYLKAKGYDRSDPAARHAALKAYNGTGPMAEAYATAAVEYADALPALTPELAAMSHAPAKGQAEALGGTGRRSLGDTVEAAWQATLGWLDDETEEHAPGGPVSRFVDWVAPGMPDAQERTSPLVGGGSAKKLGGGLVDVEGITVDEALAPDLLEMLRAAEADGVRLEGSGWRSQEEQIALRQANGCPDIWDAPAEACETPTARPGRSEHEVGAAMDFKGTEGAWPWLAANVERFGFALTVPGEPWHVSRPRA